MQRRAFDLKPQALRSISCLAPLRLSAVGAFCCLRVARGMRELSSVGGRWIRYSALPMLPEIGVNTRTSAWSSSLLVSEDICESPTNDSQVPLDTRCSP